MPSFGSANSPLPKYMQMRSLQRCVCVFVCVCVCACVCVCIYVDMNEYVCVCICVLPARDSWRGGERGAMNRVGGGARLSASGSQSLSNVADNLIANFPERVS